MPSSRKWRLAALVRTGVSRESVLITAKVFPSTLIIFTLIMESIRSFETSVLTRAKRRHSPERRLPS
jgi:hypothetical protein